MHGISWKLSCEAILIRQLMRAMQFLSSFLSGFRLITTQQTKRHILTM